MKTIDIDKFSDVEVAIDLLDSDGKLLLGYLSGRFDAEDLKKSFEEEYHAPIISTLNKIEESIRQGIIPELGDLYFNGDLDFGFNVRSISVGIDLRGAKPQRSYSLNIIVE